MHKNNQYPWWDDRTDVTAPRPRNIEIEHKNMQIFETPKDLYNYFDSQLYGCDEYKKRLSTAIWSSLHRDTKTNFLVVGPSGCGKTELARAFSKIYYNTTIFDASVVTPASYRGTCYVSDCLTNIDTSENALPPWVFIDEIDKAILKASELAPMIMNELLKLIEGGEIFVGSDERKRKRVDTSKVNFVFLGTFEALRVEQKNSIGFSDETRFNTKYSPISREALCDSKMLSDEFLGRINGGIIEVEPMDEEKAAALLSDSRYSPIKRLENLYQISIHISEEKRHELVSMTSKYGVRGIYSELQAKINDAVFDDCKVKEISL